LPAADTLAPSVDATSRVLAEVEAALFPGEGARPPNAIRAQSVAERGGQVVGKVETLASRKPRAFREATDMDGVRQVVTLVGDDAWIEDPNGVVRPATGDELATIRLAYAFVFHDWVLGSLADFDLRADDVTDSSAVIRATPQPSGPERRLFLSRGPDGLLPTRLEQVEQGETTVERFEDWRVVDGVRFSFASRQSAGDPRFDLVIRTTSLVASDSLPAGSIVPPVAAPHGSVTFTDPARARAIPLVRVGGVPLLEVTVNGVADLPFLVDTGAAATVLSAALVERLHLTARGLVEARGAGGSEVASYVDVASLSLPGVELTDQTLVALPLDSIAEALSTPIDGILGYDFLNHFAVEIDDPAARFALLPAGSYAPREGLVRLPLRLESNVPRLDGTLEGRHAGSFVLDTGNATPLLLHTTFAKEHGFLDRAHDASMKLSGIGGDEAMRQVVIASLTFGSISFQNVTAVIAPGGSGAISLESSIGNVGSALFAGRVLAFDYGAGALWVSAAAESAAAIADSASAR
jgi:predicted aspartyl protease